MGIDKYRNRLGMTLSYMGATPLFILVSGYLVYYYTAIVGLDATKIGTIILVSRVFDGFSDIIFGSVIDHTRTRLGACRPWILSMTIGSLAAIMALIFIPSNETYQYIYMFLTYNLATTGIVTLYQLSITALPTYITKDSHERSQLYIWANTGQMITQTIISGVMFKVISWLGGEQPAWTKAFLGIGVIGTILTAISVYMCREEKSGTDAVSKANAKKDVVPLGKALAACVNNKYWILLLLVIVCATAINVTTMTMTPYYAQYILGDITKADSLNAFYTWPMMLVVPGVGFILKKVGKRNIALTGSVIIIAGTLITVFIHTNMTALIAAAILKSLGIGCITAVSSAMLTDTIEYGVWKNHMRSQAVLIGAQSAGAKIGQGIASAVLTWAIGFAGFDAQSEVQTAATNSSIIRLYSIVPCVLAIAVMLFLIIYNLDKRYSQILADLKTREEVALMTEQD